MKKFTKIIAAAMALVLTFGVAGCTKSTDYPDFRNPDGGQIVETSERYVINVQSAGGLKLNGVRVAAYRNGVLIKRGISVDGKIELGISLDEYDLVVDEESLPVGYYLDGTQYKTNPDKREEVTIKIPSKVIEQSATADTTYAVGQIVRDFVFTDCTGKTHTVSDTLETKEAVVLNFFYTTCAPCKNEFPAINTAYGKNSKVEIFAICWTGRGDTNASVQSFKNELGLTFPMGMDDKNLCNNFSASAFPTTVIIDRYGLIAYRSSGSEANTSFWTKLFNDFTSDNYVQKLSSGTGEPDDPTKPGELEKPNIDMPASSDLEKAACVEGFKTTFTPDEDEYSWPWLANITPDDKYIYTSNKGKGDSYSIVYAEVEMKEDEVLAFDYNVSSEQGQDCLYALIDGEIMNGDGWSGNTGWQSVSLYVADRDRKVELFFAYMKDNADPEDEENAVEDVAKIRNIHITTKDAITDTRDVMRPCANGLTQETQDRYDYYVNAVYNPEDGFYHKDTKDGALIMLSLIQLTPWSRMHTDGTLKDESSGELYYSTLYNTTFYKYSKGEGATFEVMLGDLDITDRLITYRNISGFMEAPNCLVPVTQELYEWATTFTVEWAKENKTTTHDNEWLEFCYYYDHYGPDHDATKEECRKTDNVTLGLTRDNCYFAYEKDDPELANSATKGVLEGKNKALIEYPMDTYRGTYYEFTAKRAGVYQVRSYVKGENVSSSEKVDPSIEVYDANCKEIAGGTSDVWDADQYTVKYEGFNTYMELTAGQTVYLHLQVARNETGYYEFEVEYKGESLDKMMVCSTGGGAWTYDEKDPEMKLIYMGVKVAVGEDGYWYKADAYGEPDYTQPVYFDMLNPSFYIGVLRSLEDDKPSSLNYASLEYIIKNNYFKGNSVFKGIKFGASRQSKMQAKLNEALSRDKSDPLYGYVQADTGTTEIINQFLDVAAEGRGDGFGWEAFAVYMRHMGI